MQDHFKIITFYDSIYTDRLQCGRFSNLQCKRLNVPISFNGRFLYTIEKLIYPFILLAILLATVISALYYLVNAYYSCIYVPPEFNNGYRADNVTILIPVYNEDFNRFSNVLKSVSKQGSPFIVVGDGVNGRYKWITEALGGTFVTYPERNGKRYAMRVGVSQVKTEFVMFVDSDVIIPENTVRSLIKNFGERVGGVGPMIKIVDNGTKISKGSEFVERAREVVLRAMSHKGKSIMLDGQCSMYRTSLVKDFICSDEFTGLKLMGKPIMLGDDRQLTSHVLRKGYLTVRDPRVRVEVQPREHWSDYYKQNLRWSRAGWFAFFRDVKNGTASKAGKFYTFELTMTYILPILLIFTALMRYFPIIIQSATFSLFVLVRPDMLYLHTIIFMHHLGLFFRSDRAFLGRMVLSFISLFSTAVFGIAISSTMDYKKKISYYFSGMLALFLVFVAYITGLLTIWKQSKWLTR